MVPDVGNEEPSIRKNKTTKLQRSNPAGVPQTSDEIHKEMALRREWEEAKAAAAELEAERARNREATAARKKKEAEDRMIERAKAKNNATSRLVAAQEKAPAPPPPAEVTMLDPNIEYPLETLVSLPVSVTGPYNTARTRILSGESGADVVPLPPPTPAPAVAPAPPPPATKAPAPPAPSPAAAAVINAAQPAPPPPAKNAVVPIAVKGAARPTLKQIKREVHEEFQREGGQGNHICNHLTQLTLTKKRSHV